MAWTVNDVINQARQHFPDLTAANALVLFNDIYKEVMMDVDFEIEAVHNEPLVANQRTYPLPATVMQVHKVIYFESATVSKALAPGTLADLDKKSPLWRTEVATTEKPVAQWYTDGEKLGLYPAPATSASPTYPRVSIYYQPSPATDLVGTDPIPDNIPSIEAFLYGVCYRFAAAWNPTRTQFYQVQYLRARAALDKYLNNRSSANIGLEINPYTGEPSAIQRG